MKESSERPRVQGDEGLQKLRDFTRRILAVPKSEIAEKLEEPIYKPRKRKRRGRPRLK